MEGIVPSERDEILLDPERQNHVGGFEKYRGVFIQV